MKIRIGTRWFESEDLTYIATYQNGEDREFFYYYDETLFCTYDGKYLLLVNGNAGSKHAKLNGHTKSKSSYFKEEENPGLWLMNHNQERLAGFLFPDMREIIEQLLYSRLLHGKVRTGETFYQRDETNGVIL